MMRARLACIAVCAIGASSCVTGYAPPPAGDVATLTIETSDTGTTNLWFFRYPGGFAGYECSHSPAQAIAILNNISLVSSYADGGKNLKTVTVTIPAGEPFRLATQASTYRGTVGDVLVSWCQPHLRFQPVTGARYVAWHGLAGNACRMVLYEVNDAGERRDAAFEALPPCFDPKSGNPHFLEYVREQYERDPSRYR
jgi:hypothetical protein